jgi:hypothetical protein
MSMCFRSTFLFLRVFLSLCVLFASIHFSSSSLESRALRQKNVLRFWSFRKLMNSRATRVTWWMTMTTKFLMWMTTIVQIVFDVVVYQLIVVVSRILSATNVLNKRSRVFRYVVNLCVYDFLFNYRKSQFVFVSSFINCQTLMSFFASTKYRRRYSWKNERFYNFFLLFEIANEMIEKMLTKSTKKRYEFMKRNCFFMRNIANSLRILVKRKTLEMHVWIHPNSWHPTLSMRQCLNRWWMRFELMAS